MGNFLTLGLIDETVKPDEPCGKEQFYALMNAIVKQKTGKDAEWIDWETGDPMLRLYVPRALYEAAINMGYTEKDSARQDIANINDPTGMMNSIDIWLCGEQWRGIDVCPDYGEFCNDNTGCKDFDINTWHWFNPGEIATFAAKQECLVNNLPVMELAEDGRFRAYDAITMQEAVSAAFRLYCSFGDYADVDERYRAAEYDLHLAEAVKIQFSSADLENEVRLELGLTQDEPVYDFMLEEIGLTNLNGVLTEEIWNAAPITARGMVALLDAFVSDIAPENLDNWKILFPIARGSNMLLTRGEGACLIYGASCSACPDFVQFSSRCFYLNEKIGDKWDEYPLRTELLGTIISEPSPWHEMTFDVGAYFFALDFIGPNKEMLLDYDAQENTLHMNYPLTRSDAKKAVSLLQAKYSPVKSAITAHEMISLLDDFVEEVAPNHLDEWKEKLPTARESETKITRADAILMIYVAAFTACPEQTQFGDRWLDLHTTIGEKIWDEYHLNGNLFDHIESLQSPWHSYTYDAAAYFFTLSVSNMDNEMMFIYDSVQNSIHTDYFMTIDDAAHAINILTNDWASRYTALDDAEAITSSISAETLRLANTTPISSIDELPRLTGFVLGPDVSVHTIVHTPDQLEEIASWGFTSVRIMYSYETFFTKDVSQVNITQLRRLDALVETAIQNNLHLNILLDSLPGRTPVKYGNYQDGGEFDMFVNPTKLNLAIDIWYLLAMRYRDIPGAYLSFTPFWEADNTSLSTGAEAPAYTAQDICNGLEAIVIAIREADPDRYILYEVTSSGESEYVVEATAPSRAMMRKYDNVRIAFNYGESAYIYAGMNAAQGENIDDNNHSAFASEYPVTIYGARTNINPDHPITIDGCLPAGTKLELYVSACGKGNFTIASEKETLYQEKLSDSSYQVYDQLNGLYPYGTSEKLITITLQEDADQLILSTENWLVWVGMDITLPEEYAVER